MILSPTNEERMRQQREYERKSWRDRRLADYDKLYRSQQSWMRRAIILRAMMLGKSLPEATLTEWADEYAWVKENL